MVGFIEAKPTRYMHELFRSRLEARWAVFLHAYHGITGWGYETHKLTLTQGKPSKVLDSYTPDFSFYCDIAPKKMIFLEVKPNKPNKDYIKRLSEFSKLSDCPIMLGIGSFYKTQPVVVAFGSKGGMGKGIPLNIAFKKSRAAIKVAQSFRFDL